MHNTNTKAEKISRMTSIHAKIGERQGDSEFLYEPPQGCDTVPNILNFADDSMSSLYFVYHFLTISFSTGIRLQRQHVGLRIDRQLSRWPGNWQFMPFPIV